MKRKELVVLTIIWIGEGDVHDATSFKCVDS